MVTKTPETQRALELTSVKKFIRDIEGEFLNELTEFGDDLGLGRRWQKDKDGRYRFGLFTGQDLCFPASISIRNEILKEFGSDSDISIVGTKVKLPTEIEPVLLHWWARFKADNGQSYFIDPTYGQIDARLNRIIVGAVSDESIFYGYKIPPMSPHQASSLGLINL